MSKNASLLVVDSDQSKRDNLSRELQQPGFNIIKATTINEAMILAEKYLPDLAIIDSETNDLTVIDSDKSIFSTSRVPFIFITSANITNGKPSSFEHRAIGHIFKPVRISQLIPEIETALSRASEIKNLMQQQDNLKEALQQNREISIAIGILMAHTNYSYKQAENTMRAYARNSRQKMSHISAHIIDAAETFNALLHKITENKPHRVNKR